MTNMNQYFHNASFVYQKPIALSAYLMHFRKFLIIYYLSHITITSFVYCALTEKKKRTLNHQAVITSFLFEVKTVTIVISMYHAIHTHEVALCYMPIC